MLDLASKFWNWKLETSKYKKYRWKAKLGLAGTMRNSGSDDFAGKQFIKAYESGIKSKDVGSHYMKVKFQDGSEFTLWIENKMYAYGSGSYKTSSGELKGINGLLPKWVNLIALEIEES